MLLQTKWFLFSSDVNVLFVFIFPGESDNLLDPVSEYSDNSENELDPPDSPVIYSDPPNFEKLLNNLECTEDANGYQPSNLNYQLHPDDYLPTYNIVGPACKASTPHENSKEDNKYSLPRRRRNTDLDDLASNRFSVGGYNSANGSFSDVSQNLCEIEDSEANFSDNDSDDASSHMLQDTRL